MTATPTPVREWRNVTVDQFEQEIRPLGAPALLRGVAADWPAVAAGRAGPQAAADYLLRFDSGRPIKTLTGPPEIEGRFFYRPDMGGLNFERREGPLGAAIARLLAAAEERPPALYIESTPAPDFFPGFAEQNRLALLDPSVAPRLWIGNAITTQTHFDLNDNIACVVAGRRRFTLFPPDQIANLYVGPFDFTLSGPPVSMVPLKQPDLGAHPRFAEALKHAQVAELEPGDGIYVPYFWWHNVESLARFNVLANYWWNEARPKYAVPFDALLHSFLAFADMPDRHRAAWRALFDLFVFHQHGEPLEHLPPESRGLLGPMTPERAREIRAVLQRTLR